MSIKDHQPPMTVEEQLQNLKENGLLIEDESFARAFLNDVSYFRLVKAYSLGLKERNGCYYEGVSFCQITDLYRFNCNFRQLLFPVVECIEVLRGAGQVTCRC